jgi:hypothetical protein
MRICLVLAFLLSALCGAAQGTIVVGVEARRAGVEAQASDSFEPPVDRVYGLASVNGLGASFAAVGTTDHGGCGAQQCGTLGGSHAITEVDAEVMRWRVHTLASGASSAALAGFRLTDRLIDRGQPDPFRTIDFHVHIELQGLSANRGTGIDAGSGFSYGVFLPAQDETGPTPLFEFGASADDVLGEGLTRRYRASMFGAAPIEDSDIPSVFEATFSVPWVILAAADFELEVGGSASGFADVNGSAIVSSYNSSWLGIRIDGAVAESESGYRYVGFVPGGPTLPEPGTWALLLAAGAAAARTARRQRPRRFAV